MAFKMNYNKSTFPYGGKPSPNKSILLGALAGMAGMFRGGARRGISGVLGGAAGLASNFFRRRRNKAQSAAGSVIGDASNATTGNVDVAGLVGAQNPYAKKGKKKGKGKNGKGGKALA